MKRKRNLEKAIVLGLLLSAGVYGTAWAEIAEEDKWENAYNWVDEEDYTVSTAQRFSAGDFSSNTGDKGTFYYDQKSYYIRAQDNGAAIGIHDGAILYIGEKDSSNVTDVVAFGLGADSIGKYGIYNAHYSADPTKPSGGGGVLGIHANKLLRIEGSLDGINTVSDVDFNLISKAIAIEGTGNIGINASNGGKFILNAETATGELIKDQTVPSGHSDETAVVEGTYDGINITGGKAGIISDKSDIDLISGYNTTVIGGKFVKDENEEGVAYTDGIALNATTLDNGDASSGESTITLQSGNLNDITGAVVANGNNAKITVGGITDAAAANSRISFLNSGDTLNRVYSAAVIDDAGDLTSSTDEEMKKLQVVSALYAEEGANLTFSGVNEFRTYADEKETGTSERVLWAYKGASIDVDGHTTISTDDYDSSPNSKDIAVAAGTAANLTDKTVTEGTDEWATVNIDYDNTSSAKSDGYDIEGDILAAYGGQVNINPNENTLTRAAGNKGINVHGNLLAGNNGILSIDIGSGSLTGRADDYGDAGLGIGAAPNDENSKDAHQSFYNPAFSSEIYKGGRIDLNMGAGSVWYVTGQSWITSINTPESEAKNGRATIDLVTKYENDEKEDVNASALTVYEVNGDADFIMELDGERSSSDMLYIKKADGNYRIVLDKSLTSEDLYFDSSTGQQFSGLRFATVGAGSTATFEVGSYDTGEAFDVKYQIDTDEYGSAETEGENAAYNGDGISGGKPGDDMVDNFFGSDGEPIEADAAEKSAKASNAANSIMLLNDEAAANDAGDAEGFATDTNIKIVDREAVLSDVGKTIVNMSRANYSNAIYMDRLNKRMGEARYINGEEDEGMWVRLRHDRIGKTDAYRSQNTMYELGYDVKQECDKGERRVGFAVDYMHGDTSYSNIAGKGEIDRYGLWLYDTWLGDKGHYTDYVLKWGHLSNDFEVYSMRFGNKITGDYSNNMFSVSAEYGKKNDMGNDWYFEPQAQLQLARVTGADYTTNQDTRVSVDGINSLIGRAGFRLGKDFGEDKQSTVYIKADVLHEFLGDQDIYVYDRSSDNKWADVGYDNQGTWYDVGFGFATVLGNNSYAFMDFEKSFGNDNDETYQINAGVQWTF